MYYILQFFLPTRLVKIKEFAIKNMSRNKFRLGNFLLNSASFSVANKCKLHKEKNYHTVGEIRIRDLWFSSPTLIPLNQRIGFLTRLAGVVLLTHNRCALL